jgi:hypothetical protein
MLCCLVVFFLRILVELSLLISRVEIVRSAYYNGDDLDLESFFPVVSHYGLFEWFIYVVYVGDGVHGVAICGLLTLYES